MLTSTMCDKVYCLSDSDDEMVKTEEASDQENESKIGFPSIGFHYDAPQNNEPNFQNNQESDIDEEFIKVEPSFDVKESLSKTDYFPSVGFDYNASNDTKVNFQNNQNSEVYDHAAFIKSDDFSDPENTSINNVLSHNDEDPFSDDSEQIVDQQRKTRKNSKATKPRKSPKKKNSDRELERKRAKEQAVMEKNQKSIEMKKRKNMQPGECLKFVHVDIDENLSNEGYYSEILDAFVEHDISCKLQSLPVPRSVMWTRTIEDHYVDHRNEICTRTEKHSEKDLVVIWDCNYAVQAIMDQTFIPKVTEVACLIPNKRVTLVICGMEKYFESSKNSSKNSSQKNTSKKTKVAKISRYDLEANLAEIQLTLDCGSCLVESPQEVAALVFRFTKAIAEIPLKLERRRKYLDKIDWYAMGDNKDTVKVDKDGNGLKRLWQQQLCQFTLASLETAEAICSLYPSPQELIQAYSSCTPDEGEKLLKDIPIRRAAGPLSTARKIGPELSKKIFIMFTSHDGEETLGNDRE